MACVRITSYVNNQSGAALPLHNWELISYFVLLVTGTLGNSLVCLIICKSNSVFRSTSFNMYLCSLAVPDMVLELVLLPCYVLSTPIFHHPDGVWGDVLCKTITANTITSYFWIVSEYSIILVGLERLLAVRKSSVAISHDSTTRRNTWLSIFTAWFIAFVLKGPKVIYFFKYKRGQRPTVGSHCRCLDGTVPTLRSQICAAVKFIATALAPLLIIVYSFYSIRKYLLTEEKGASRQLRNNSFSDEHRYFFCWQTIKRRQRTVKSLMIATAIFVLSWMPCNMMFFIINYIIRWERRAQELHGIPWCTKFVFSWDILDLALLPLCMPCKAKNLENILERHSGVCCLNVWIDDFHNRRIKIMP